MAKGQYQGGLCFTLSLPLAAPSGAPGPKLVRNTFEKGMPCPKVYRSSLDPTLKLGAGRVQEGVEKAAKAYGTPPVVSLPKGVAGGNPKTANPSACSTGLPVRRSSPPGADRRAVYSSMHFAGIACSGILFCACIPDDNEQKGPLFFLYRIYSADSGYHYQPLEL